MSRSVLEPVVKLAGAPPRPCAIRRALADPALRSLLDALEPGRKRASSTRPRAGGDVADRRQSNRATDFWSRPLGAAKLHGRRDGELAAALAGIGVSRQRAERLRVTDRFSFRGADLSATIRAFHIAARGREGSLRGLATRMRLPPSWMDALSAHDPSLAALSEPSRVAVIDDAADFAVYADERTARTILTPRLAAALSACADAGSGRRSALFVGGGQATHLTLWPTRTDRCDAAAFDLASLAKVIGVFEAVRAAAGRTGPEAGRI